MLPLVAGYAVARAAGAGSLKWPNDVLLGGRKVCGILVERVHVHATVATGRWPWSASASTSTRRADELPVDTATSLTLESGPVDRTELFGQVLHELRARLGVMTRSPHTFVSTYRGLCDTLDRDVRVDLPDGSVLEGRAVEIDEHGRLVVEGAAGTSAVAAGDVVHVRPAQ